jgi:hypothetical protein
MWKGQTKKRNNETKLNYSALVDLMERVLVDTFSGETFSSKSSIRKKIKGGAVSLSYLQRPL